MKNMQPNEEMINDLEIIQKKHDIPSKVFDAMRIVDRELFLPEEYKFLAYNPFTPAPIGEYQTCSAPDVVSVMCGLLHLEEDQKVLEIGSGCGYHACITAEIVYPGRVISLEINPKLAYMARKNISGAKKAFNRDWNIVVINEDGSGGYEKEKLYDRIYFTAGIPDYFTTDSLYDQLTNGGRFLLAPKRGSFKLGIKKGDGTREEKNVSESGYTFVSLKGKYGFN